MQKKKEVTVGVVGYGFVGQALASGFEDFAEVLINDVNPDVDSVDIDDMGRAKCVFICVPTPMDAKTGKIDTSIVEDVVDQIYDTTRGSYHDDHPIVVIKSTITPDALIRMRDRYGKDDHTRLRLVMNPEFLVEKTAIEDFENQSRIVLGGDRRDCNIVRELYRKKWGGAMYWMVDLVTASLVKYMNNAYLSLKLSFVAEWHKLAEAAGIEDPQVLVAAFLGDRRVGDSHTKQPGPDGQYGWGGKCFPKDINAIIGYADENGIDMKTLKAAWETNLAVREVHDWLTIQGAVSGEPNG